MIRATLCLSLFTSLASPVFGDDKANASTPLQKAYAKQRKLFSEYSTESRKLAKNPELVKLRQAWLAAEKELRAKVAGVTEKERAAQKAAQDALNKAIEKKIAGDDEIGKLQQKVKSAENKKRDVRFEIAQVSLRLYHNDSPLQRQLDEDPTIAKLRKAMYTGTRKERNAAYRKYYAERKAKLKSLAAAKPLLAKIDELNKEISELDKKRFAISKEIFAAKRKIQFGKDKDLQPLRDKLTKAARATYKASYQKNTKELRTASFKAAAAYRKKQNELTKANKTLVELQQKLNDVNKTIRELRAKKKK